MMLGKGRQHNSDDARKGDNIKVMMLGKGDNIKVMMLGKGRQHNSDDARKRKTT